MTTRMTLAATVVTTLLATGWPAAAQPEAFVLIEAPDACSGPCAGTLIEARLEPPAVMSSWTVPYGGDIRAPYATPDGRYLLWLDTSTTVPTLALHDRVSRTTSALPMSATVTGFLGNPTRAEIYLSDSAGVVPVALSAAGARVLSSPGCTSVGWHAVSDDGRRGVFACGGHGLVVADLAAGTVVSTLAVTAAAALSSDGSALYAAVRDFSGLVVRKYDVATGGIAAEAPIPVPSFLLPTEHLTNVGVDARTGRVVVQGKGLYVFNAQTFAVDDSRLVPGYAQFGSATSVTDALRSRLYVAAVEAFEPFFIPSYSVHVFDTDRLTPVLSAGVGAPARIVGAPLPPVPAAPQVTIAGGQVTLTWAPGAAAPLTTRYVIEAGTAPGRVDIIGGLDVGAQTSLSASGVPPGTYYVRVRAGNYAGLSGRSNEVVVQVP